MQCVLAVVLLFFGSVLAYAECDPVISDLLRKNHSDLLPQDSDYFICKTWPHSPNKTLVVMAKILNTPNQEKGTHTYAMDVVIVDAGSQKIMSHLYEEKAFGDDAIYTYDIKIDTARYQLNAKDRAFGVRFYKKGSAHYNPSYHEVLNLYYLQDKTLHRVLKGLSMREEYGEFEEPLYKCDGSFEKTDHVLWFDNNKTNGFNNLKINELITRTKLKGTPRDDCNEVVASTKKSSLTLRYNGKKYVVPKQYFGSGFNPAYCDVTAD